MLRFDYVFFFLGKVYVTGLYWLKPLQPYGKICYFHTAAASVFASLSALGILQYFC